MLCAQGGFGISYLGAVRAETFVEGRMATSLASRDLYDTATGDILFDGDGYSGGFQAEGYVIGHVAAGTDLLFTDFFID